MSMTLSCVPLPSSQNKAARSLKATPLVMAIALSMGALLLGASDAQARTVSAGSNQCERAKEGRDQAVRDEIYVIKKTHEMMEVSRSVHAQCMKYINENVGERISSIDSDSFGGFGGLLGQVTEIFDISGKVCDEIQRRVSNEQQKIANAIAKAEPLLKDASEIAQKGKEIIDKNKDKIDEIFDREMENSKEPNDPNAPAPSPAPSPASAPAPASAPPASAFSPTPSVAAPSGGAPSPQPAPAPAQSSNPWATLQNLLNSGGSGN